jgi:hypothetical protein
MNVADLTEEPGGQHRPDPEQRQQAGVGFRDRGLDARLHRSDLLLQLADVADQVSGQLPAGDRRRTGGPDRGQQRLGALGGEVTSSPTWD